MGRIEKFEDIKAWQLARELVKKVYEQTRKGDLSKGFGFKDQIQRAAVSAMSNIAEGFERYSSKEFVQFLNISRSSAEEVRSLLYVASDLGYLDPEIFKDMLEHCKVLSRHIWNFMKYLKSSKV